MVAERYVVVKHGQPLVGKQCERKWEVTLRAMS